MVYRAVQRNKNHLDELGAIIKHKHAGGLGFRNFRDFVEYTDSTQHSKAVHDAEVKMKLKIQ